MIRTATADDKARVITLLAHSREAAGYDRADGPTGFCFPFDPAYAERLFLVHQMPRHLCLVLDIERTVQGLLMALWSEHPFGPVRLARETVWWIEPDYRGLNASKMLHDYETWARGQGCDFIGMAGMGDDPQVGRLYQRRGYRPAELHFLKAA